MKRRIDFEDKLAKISRKTTDEENLFEKTIKDFQNNKIHKKFLWNETILEHLGDKSWSDYLEKETLGIFSFEKASIAIEAATKIYSEKINSLYEETQKASKIVSRSTIDEDDEEEEEIQQTSSQSVEDEGNEKKKRKNLFEKTKKIEIFEENLCNLYQKTFYSSFVSDGKMENSLINKLTICPKDFQLFYDIESSVRKKEEHLEEEELENEENIHISEEDLPLDIFNFQLERSVHQEHDVDDAGTQNSQLINQDLEPEVRQEEPNLEDPRIELEKEFERTHEEINEKIEKENVETEKKRQKINKKKVKKISVPKKKTKKEDKEFRTPQKVRKPKVKQTPEKKDKEFDIISESPIQKIFEDLLSINEDEIEAPYDSQPQMEEPIDRQEEIVELTQSQVEDVVVINEKKSLKNIEDIKKYKNDVWKEIETQEDEIIFSKLNIKDNLYIGFVTLLHLAAEHNLELKQDDLSDIKIIK